MAKKKEDWTYVVDPSDFISDAALEAIDHDAYIAADATLKAELEAEIEKKADADKENIISLNKSVLIPSSVNHLNSGTCNPTAYNNILNNYFQV